MKKYTLNKIALREYLAEHNLTAAEASRLMGKEKSYVSCMLRCDTITESTVNNFCSLGISKAILTNQNATVETVTGKVLEKPLEEQVIEEKLEETRAQKVAKMTDENGNRLSFGDRMEILGSPIRKDDDVFDGFRFTMDADKIEFRSVDRYKIAYEDLTAHILRRFAENPETADISILQKIQLIAQNTLNN